MSNRKSLWSDDEGSDEDNDSETRKDMATKEVPPTQPVIQKPKDKIVDTKFEQEFESLWDKFPEPDEFKSIYGIAIWERLSSAYTEFVQQIEAIDKRQERLQEKRTTCWDTISKPPQEEENKPAEEEPTPGTEEPAEAKRRGRPPNASLTPEELEKRRQAEKERRENPPPPDEPRVKRKYTKRADKEKMLALLEKEGEEKGEQGPNNTGYKPRSLRTDAKNTGPRMLQCLHCDKRFESKGQARPHLEVHSGIKPYRCAACDYRSYSKHNVTDAHFTKKHGRKGTLSDVFTDQNDKQNLKALVIMESEQMLQKQEKLDRLSREQVNQNDIAKGEADSPSTQNPSDQNTSGNNTVNNQENAKPKAEPHPLALLLAERQKIFGKPKLPNPEAENKSKELLDKMSKQMYEGGEKRRDASEEDEDENISKDLLDSLCAESESPTKDETNSNNNNKEEKQIQLRRKRASSYDSSSEFEKVNPKDLDWVPANKKAALENKLKSMENVNDSTPSLEDIQKATAKRKRYSSEAGDLNDQNTDNGWKPAIKPPESEEIKDEIVAKAKVSEIKTNESMEPEASVSDNELAAKLAESEEEGDKDKVDNNNNQEKQKDENNNPKDDIDEDAPLKKPPKKGKLNNLVEKIPKKELTDPVDIQLAQVTGK